MIELNLKQIVDKLNAEFRGDTRKLIFWYDADAEFAGDIETLKPENAEILCLEPDNLFFIKYFLEREDTKTNYLLYAPFAKPELKDNHLADMLLYSKEFFADKASLICSDLGMDGQLKTVIQRHIKFFGDNERTRKFYNLGIEAFNERNIETGLLSVLCGNKTASFDEVMRRVLNDGSLNDNKYLAEFEKYGLLNAFWKYVKEEFGYDDTKPTLEKFVITVFITYAAKTVHEELPSAWKKFLSYRPGNIIVFADNLMNNELYAARFDEFSESVCKIVHGETYFGEMKIESLADCCLFADIDRRLIEWMISRLENEDTGARLNDKTIPEICAERRKMHFGRQFENEYRVIENACRIIAGGAFKPVGGFKQLVKAYLKSAFKLDTHYRYFYYYLDRAEDAAGFEKLRELVENIYTNDYLNNITVNWNTVFMPEPEEAELGMQINFFKHYLNYAKDRVVVIISDALRYEAAYTLFERLKADEKCTASITAMQGVIPSYTPLGMAALLPHRTLEYSDSYEVLIDGKPCASLGQRQTVLRNYKPNSKCVRLDDIKNMKQAELRSIFTGQDIVYVYHNQIDAIGDNAKTENEVFNACEEAIGEIHSLIRRISSLANTHHFLVTADHGFIYKRDKIQANDKIGAASGNPGSLGRRYFISEKAIEAEGVCSVPLSFVLGNKDGRFVSFPLASDIFSAAGAGQNYVHGGCSPQETLVPVIDVKVDKNRIETAAAGIALAAAVNKITNLITTLDFVQTEPVGNIIKAANYRIYFISEDNEKISNENICIADKTDKDSIRRLFRFTFRFKGKQYDKSKKYYLVVYDDKNDVETLRREVIMDIALADDFGFFS